VDATLIFQKLVDNLPIGSVVRELHIMSANIPIDVEAKLASDVIKQLEGVISKGHLPSTL